MTCPRRRGEKTGENTKSKEKLCFYGTLIFNGKKQEKLKSLLMKVREESEKAGLIFNIQKTKIMAFSPIISWQIDGGKVETVTDFIFLGSKITADGDCIHKIKMLAPWKKSYDQPRQPLKSRDITLPAKACVVKAMVFLVIMYRCESWTIKKGEHRRIDAFQLVLEKTLESPLDSKEIKPINPRGNQP